MKRHYYLFAYVLICCLPLCAQIDKEVDYFLNNSDLGGDVIIKSSETFIEGDNAIVTFAIDVPVSGLYYANFWMFPTKLKDGSYAKYSVAVNGDILGDKIIPSKGDWHDITMSNNEKILLSEGLNHIAVIGTVPDIPNVEHVKLSSILAKASIDATKYENYKAVIEQSSFKNTKRNSIVPIDTFSVIDVIDSSKFVVSRTSAAEDPLYNYEYALRLDIKYTFYKKLHFTEGEQVNITTNGVNDFAHVLELFSSTSSFENSWSCKSNGSCIASLNITIPITGNYYVRVRSYQNGHSGLCNLNVNGENFYENIPVYSVGIRCLQPARKYYNTFTCNNTTNPMLWIEEGSNFPGTIYAFNDNYSRPGCFDWGTNARIVRSYRRDVHAVLLSTSKSSNPTGKCDLYMKCLNVGAIASFPNLSTDDAIQSSPATSRYNCISWSGAITSYWEWPLDPMSSFYSPDSLTAFDNFYASRGLTRTGATANNGVVALWANIDSIGNRVYTHASVRNGADDNLHGYDWESKAGPNVRLFHPRNALNGLAYGQIVEYYKKNSTSLASSKTIEEEIADGTTRIEYVDFTSNEKEFLFGNIQTINSEIMQRFDVLYGAWRKIIENTVYSNLAQVADCDEYRYVLDFCRQHQELLYLLYEKVGVGELAATKLVADLTFDRNVSVVEYIRESVSDSNARSEIKTIRPLLSNYVAYIKELLSIENNSLVETRRMTSTETGISYSNFNDIEVASSQVDFTLNSSAQVSLLLLDLSGNTLSVIIDDELLDSGNHSFLLPEVTANVFLVQLLINGRVNIKKVYQP